jgi:hypothetical protein
MQARDIRESVKRDYDDLVNNLFSTSFALKNRFEEYRLSLYEDVVEDLFSIRKVSGRPLQSNPGWGSWQADTPALLAYARWGCEVERPSAHENDLCGEECRQA